MDSDRSAELQEACQAIGQQDEERGFIVGEECKNALSDLDNLLRTDNSEEQRLYLHMGEWQMMRTHLLPLMQLAPELSDDLKHRTLRLLVRLTMPLTSVVENKITRTQQLQQYKTWMLEGNTMITLMFIMTPALERIDAQRTPLQRNMLELGLSLIRNLLAVPDPTAAASEYSQKLHDRCILQMHEAMVLETLTVLSASIDADTETPIKYLLLECFSHLFRQEKNVDDLFVGALAAQKARAEATMSSQTSAKEDKSQSKSQSKPASNSAASAAASVPLKSKFAKDSFLQAEAMRLGDNLAAQRLARRLEEGALMKQGIARHARFGSKYAVRVVTPGGSSDPSHAVSVGPDGELIAASAPRVSGGGTQVFATRFVRNPFGTQNHNRMVNDALPGRFGRKPVIGNAGPRAFLNVDVKHALHSAACLMLDGGGYNVLMRSILHELTVSSTKDVVLSEDALKFMALSAFFMHFQRVRAKEPVEAADKKQKIEDEAAEKAAAQRAKEEAALAIKEKEARERQARADEAMFAAAAGAGSAPSIGRMFPLSASPSDEIDLTTASGVEGVPSSNAFSGLSSMAPAFPNAVDSQGRMVFNSQIEGAASTVPAAAAPVQAPPAILRAPIAGWSLSEEGADASMAPLAATTAAAAASSSAAAAVPAAPAPKPESLPFVRRHNVSLDVKPIASSIHVESWKFLNSRVKRFLEDKPLPWPHLEAAMAMYSELIRCLYDMTHMGSASTRLKADSLRRSLFYDRESVELYSKLIGGWKSSLASKAYLADLVSAAHFQMQLLKDLSDGGNFTILEKRRKLIKRHRPVNIKEIRENKEEEAAEDKPKVDEEAMPPQPTEEEEDANEPGMQAHGAAAAAPSSPSPAAKSRLARAAAFMDDAEDEPKTSLFPELTEESETSPGRPLTAAELATRALKASRAASALPSSLPESKQEEEGLIQYDASGNPIIRTIDNPDEYEEYDEYEVEEDSRVAVRRESEFDFRKFLMRFAHQTVVANYMELLADFRTNSMDTNLQILAFMQRLSDAHLTAFFFQLSSFITFEKIVTDPWVRLQKPLNPLRDFIKANVVRTFLNLACKTETDQSTGQVSHPNRHFWIETLFWKNFTAADKLLNEHGWFDSSKDRAQSARDLEALEAARGSDDEDDGWVDIDEDDEEFKLAARRAADVALDGAEAELAPRAWAEPASAAEGARIKVRQWDAEEDKILREQYPEFADMDAVWDILVSMLPLRTAGQIKERSKKLGLIQKRAHTAAASKSADPKAAAMKELRTNKKNSKKVLTLSEILDRHGVFTKVPLIDDVMDSLRELVIELVQKDCRSSMACMILELKRCRDQRAANTDMTDDGEAMTQAPPPVFLFEAKENEGWDHEAIETLEQIAKIIGIKEQDDPAGVKEGAWEIGSHFTAKDLSDYISLLEATLDSPQASAPRDRDVENDAEISRLLSHAHESEEEPAEEEAEAYVPAPAPKVLSAEEQAEAARKAARRAKREAKDLQEALDLKARTAELNGGLVDQLPRRRRQEAIVAERLAKERQLLEERRAREQAADDDAEAEFVPSAETTGSSQQTAASQAANLNDFMAQKRKRAADVLAARLNKSKATEETPPKRARKDAAAAVPDSTPAAAPGKRRLRRAIVDDDEVEASFTPNATASRQEEEEEEVPATEEPEAAAAEAESDSAMASPAAASAASAASAADSDDDAAAASSQRRKAKPKTRRRVLSDDEDEAPADEPIDESRAEGEREASPASSEAEGMRTDGVAAMELDDTDAPPRAVPASTQAVTQPIDTGDAHDAAAAIVPAPMEA